MPKQNLETDLDEDVEIPADAEPKEVVIDLDEIKTDPVKQDSKQLLPVPQISAEELAKLHRRMEFQARAFERSTKQVSELASQIQSMREATTQAERQTIIKDQPGLDPEIQSLAERDWQKAVKVLATKEAEALIEQKLKERELKQSQIEAQRSNQQAQVTEWERSKQKVTQRYPSLLDDGSDEANLFREVYNEDQSLYRNIHGPEIAMYRMEEKLRASGKTPASVRSIVDRETSRIARAQGSAIVGRPASNGKQIRLTVEQVKFCQDHHLSQESYAKSLARMQSGEGVEV